MYAGAGRFALSYLRWWGEVVLGREKTLCFLLPRLLHVRYCTIITNGSSGGGGCTRGRATRIDVLVHSTVYTRVRGC